MTLRIGPIVVDPPVVLAPMAGVTDAPFRVLCAEQGGGLFVSEMVTARGLIEGNAKTQLMIRHHPAERVRSLQLYGSDPPIMGEAVRRLVQTGAVDHIDLNFGCPVPKITRNGGGAALPVKRMLLAAMVDAAVRSAGEVPVTVKMRMGLDDARLTHLEAGRIAADQGAAAIALHARTAVQGYAGDARWPAIAELREVVPSHVPVLGNGDIWSGDDATAMVAATGCDGVVVGRGCLGRPWLFADLARAFAGRPVEGPPPLGTTAELARRHLDLALRWEAVGDEIGVVRSFRKHLRWYLQGYPTGRDVHRRAGLVRTAADVRGLLDDLDPSLAVVPGAIRAPRGRMGPIGRLVLPAGWCADPDAEATVEEPVGAVSGG
jgi:nifR3 family TIM-barrel protein